MAIFFLLIIFSSFSSYRALAVFLLVVIDVSSAFFGLSHNNDNRRSSCHNNGGSCDSMFGCILNKGYMSGNGGCGGFLTVCCIQPSFVSRRFKENSIFDSVSFTSKKINHDFLTLDISCCFNKKNLLLIIFFTFQGPLDFGPVVNDPVCGRPPNANRYINKKLKESKNH